MPSAAATAMNEHVLVTGVAGFIGFHVAMRLLAEGRQVVGVDNLIPYYDPALKESRLSFLKEKAGFSFERIDLADELATAELFARVQPTQVVHLAAQAGVRQSLIDPRPYITSNIVAFLNVLEGCRNHKIEHLVYASSSSVYGANRTVPFNEHDNVNHPVSLYAATKKSNELMAHSYAHLFGLPSTGLRFFTVYGPWGRPDMAVYLFADAIAHGKPINVANGGKVWRDFTYIDDVVEGVMRIMERPAAPDPAWDAAHPDPATSAVPHRVYNIGNNRPEELSQLIVLLEKELGRSVARFDVPLPPGDVLETAADITDLARDIGFSPATPLHEGIHRFVEWYRNYYGLLA